ncbi:MAG: prolyl oligopeptidase family serine peptidase [Planctomycetes bacterium]|nr:prolyl oligopeptidase family serine peptidase [Planctomycetota bacterium]
MPRPSRWLFLSALLAAATALPAQQKPLTHDDYDQWRSLRGTTFSQDGSWAAYELAPQFGDGVLEVRQTAGDKLYTQPLGTSPRFTADGRFVVFTLTKSKVEERDKKIADLRKKAKEGNQPASGRSEEGAAGEAGGEGPGGRGGPGAAAGGRRGSFGGAMPGGGFGGRRGGGAGPGGAASGPGGPGADRGELVVLDLATGAVEKLGKVKGSTVSDDVPFLLIHREKVEAKEEAAPADAAKGEPEEPKSGEPNPGEPKAEVGVGAGAGGETGEARRGRGTTRRGPPADPVEQKRPEGSDLVVRDLSSGQERTLHDVVAYGLSGKGKWLWYHTAVKKPVEGARYGLFVQPLAGGDAVQLLDGIAHVGNVTITRAEDAIAFTSDLTDFQADKPQDDLYLWDGAAAPARRIAFVSAPGMAQGKAVGGSVSFSRDGSMLSFVVRDLPEKEPLAILPEDKVALDIWNWRDGQLQTVQQKRGGSERNPSWTAVWHRDQARLVTLGDDDLRSLRFLGSDGARLIGNDDHRYEQEVTWDGRYTDVWLVNAVDGARTLVLERLRGNVTTSPGGRYVLWFGADYHWHRYDVATGERKDLTGVLPVPFHQFDDDHPEPDGAFGIAGFTKDDNAVLLYDEFDLWQVALGTGVATNVTDGYGRANRLRLRVQQLPRDDDEFYVRDELLLTAVHVDSKAEGFFVDSLAGVQRPQRLVMADVNFGDVRRPKRTDRLFFTRSTFAEFPDLWVANADFSGMKKLSNANPQQQDHRWGKAELVQWIDGNGQPRQGILIKPDGFDPKQKYPMMVYFYERMTQGLHNYRAPAPGTSPNASYYVSNGYLWFEPDVVYQVGYPGESCVKCVVSGVQHLIAQGFVDEQAIGAAGHSWGGYQTAFLITRTNIFAAVESGAPVSNMISAYGGIRYESGASRQFQYEQTQSRIGGTPWQYPLRYMENSPIYFADKVATPILIMANDQDGAVPWTQGIEYFTALRRLGKEAYLFNYNGEAHGLRQRQNMRDWTRRMSEYFDHHLRGKPAPKWMSEGVPFVERDSEKLPFAQSYIDAYVKPAPAEAVAEASAAVGNGASTGGAAAPAASSSDEARITGGSGGGREPRGERPASTLTLKVGDQAPEFVVADDTGAVHHLAGYRGRMLLLWFYPKANSMGCTTEACGLRDEFAAFERAGVAVLGVSHDPAEANRSFREAQQLPFPLLCDTDRQVSIAYGAAKDKQQRSARRIAFLIDGDGRIVRVFERIDVTTFAKEALASLPL